MIKLLQNKIKINEEDLFKITKGLEEEYLIQNLDWTFTIDNLVYNDVVNFIKYGFDQINSLIEQDALKFKLENNEIVNPYQNLEDVPRTRSCSEYENILSSYYYYYQWYWLGYKINVNKKGTQLINNLFKRDTTIFGELAWLATTINPAAVDIGFIVLGIEISNINYWVIISRFILNWFWIY